LHVLLTNDDGFEAPGLAALFRAFHGQCRLSVVAPAGECSRVGAASTMSGPIRVRRVVHDIMGTVDVVEGMPADCVRLGLTELLDEPVDCVIAGINYGANISVVDIAMSGTVAAAREAGILGTPGMAVSQMFRGDEPVDWTSAATITRRLLPQLFRVAVDPAVVWNVNLPVLDNGNEPEGARVVPVSNDHLPMQFSSDGRDLTTGRTYEYAGCYEDRTIAPNTDVALAFSREVSITPLRINPTDTSAIRTDAKFDVRSR
jgi:5'/3'-nucleotidase